jgi:hypothetical protein
MSTPELSPSALCTIDEVVAMLKLSDRPPDPLEVARAIEGASDAIHTFTKRLFAGGEPGVRVFPPQQAYLTCDGWLLITGDAHTITSVKDATPEPEGPLPLAYRPAPLNVMPGYPYTGVLLEARPLTEVAVEAEWGWAAVPDDVHYAAIQQSAAWYTLDSSRVSQTWAEGLGAAAAPPSTRSLAYGVKDTVRPYRMVSLA